MTLFSFRFFEFLFVGIFLYYVFPKRFQWFSLLCLSIVFYVLVGGAIHLPFILFSTIIVYVSSFLIENTKKADKQRRAQNDSLTPEEKKRLKAITKKKCSAVFWGAFILDIVVLFLTKYYNSLASLFVGIFTSKEYNAVHFIVPLGISYYSFQSLSYLIDVYSGSIKAEKNIGKLALYILFFPQILQGPISRYNDLGTSLQKEHPFSLHAFENGCLLILWGYFKKLVVADRLAPLVQNAFATGTEYGGGLILFSVFIYAIQLYTDFSGGIDIIRGVAELFGISLVNNFKRPYFASSLGDFWRRWHITLGTWMRDYVFYPFVLTKPVLKITKALSKSFPNLSRAFPAIVGNIVVFFLVGLWHGAQGNFILWGLYNGIILAISSYFDPWFKAFQEKHVKLCASRGFYVFRVIRTFLIVLLGYYFDCFRKATDVFVSIGKLFSDFRFHELNLDTMTNLLQLGSSSEFFKWLIVIIISSCLLFCVSFSQERGHSVRKWIFGLPIIIRWAIIMAFMLGIGTFAITNSDVMGGFLYEAF